MHILQSAGIYVWKNLGHCKTCISKAFLAAAGVWTLSTIVSPPAWPFVVTCAVFLTALWITHFVVHTIKKFSAVGPTTESAAASSGRRKALLFVRALAVSAAASTIPSNAFAMGSCGSCGAGRTDYQCYRDGYDGRCYRCRSCGQGCGDYVC